jgi:hypothetical protein
VARYDRLLKKRAVAAIAAMPMLLAAVSNRAVEVPGAYGSLYGERPSETLRKPVPKGSAPAW